jgi:hypothetical protein
VQYPQKYSFQARKMPIACAEVASAWQGIFQSGQLVWSLRRGVEALVSMHPFAMRLTISTSICDNHSQQRDSISFGKRVELRLNRR